MARANGREDTSVVTVARDYLGRGWRPIPVPGGEKGPTRPRWQHLRIDAAELAKYFPSGHENIGLLLGEPSGGLVDVDLDAPEAVAVAAVLLPTTARRHGRHAKQTSHWWYIADPIPRTATWKDVDQRVLCELRSTGHQTIVPPSVHPSGESLTWEEEGDPLHISGDALHAAVANVAACALLARHWPPSGGRHEVVLPLAGFLLRGGLSPDLTVMLVETAARAAGDEEWRERGKDVRTTARRLVAGEPVTGARTLASLLTNGDAVLAQLRRWLGLRGEHQVEVPYYTSAAGLFWRRPTQGGIVPVRLTNFTAHIAADITEDDGVERRHLFELEAMLDGVSTRVAVPANQFQAMTWPMEQLGAGAVVFPSQGLRDHTRAAIQLLSGRPALRTIYTHLGWRQIGDSWVYLHAGGAIGADGPIVGIEVRPPEALARFALPAPVRGTELVQAVEASLRVLDLGPDEVTIPILASVFRSVLGPADFSVHLTGRTGTGKSELAALAQQHFGPDMDARHLPASWSSTGNALEGVAFAAKDAILVVDDFAPTGASGDIQRYHREADRLLRAQGNQTGRGRMRADATLRAAKPPRGLILSTGEDIPRGQSLRARLLVLETSGLAWDRLSDCQADAACGHYARVVAAFAQWLAPQYRERHHRLRAEVAECRQAALRSDQHRRTATIVGDLAVGWRTFLEFGQRAGALTPELAEELWARGWRALGELAEDQVRHQRVSDPVRLFVDLLSGALVSGRAHVTGPMGAYPEDTPQAWGWRLYTVGTGEYERDEWRPQGDRVGWLDGDDLYLDPHAAVAAAQRFGRDSGEQIPLTPRTLTRRLKEHGLLVNREEARGVLTVRRMLEGKRRDVLHLAASTLEAPGPDQPDQSDPDPASGQPGGGDPRRGPAPPSSRPTQAERPTGETRAATPVDMVGLVGPGVSGDWARSGHDARSSSVEPQQLFLACDAARVQPHIDPSGWPSELPARGPRCPGVAAPCSVCSTETWVSYGGEAFCCACAVAAFTTRPAGNGAPKSSHWPSGATSSDGPSRPSDPTAG